MRRKIYSWYFVVGIIFIIAISMCYRIYPITDRVDLILFITTVIGLVTSFLALTFTINTFISIDSVNAITQMEGNLLENENYITSYTKLIREYNMNDSQDIFNKIISELTTNFRYKSKTAKDFAYYLQEFIDFIIIFPYLHIKEENNNKKMSELIQLVDRKKQQISSISAANSILINETVVLIKAIIQYQESNDLNNSLSILDVRGTMIINPITQTVYYDYLGLYYNRKARLLLNNKLHLENQDLFSIEGLKELKHKLKMLTKNDVDDMELLILFLKEAKLAFQKALKYCNNDIMWLGFIHYNEARVTYLLQLVSTHFQEEKDIGNWETIMNEAIMSRNRFRLVIEDIFTKGDGGKETFLQKAFHSEYYLASLIKMNILVAENQDISDASGITKYCVKDNYKGLNDDSLIAFLYDGIFPNIRDYQVKLKNYLSESCEEPEIINP